MKKGKKWKKKAKINLISFVFCPTINLELKSLPNFFIGEKESWTKKNEQIKEMISMRMLVDTVQQVMSDVCTKFLGAIVPKKSLTQMSLCITLE